MRLLGVLDFLDVTAAAAFDVPPAQAIAYFEGKGLRATFSYADMLRDEHRTAFTVAKMMDLDLLKDVQDSLDMALADGVPFSEWKKQIMPVLQAKGWWGKANMVDPLTGELKRVTTGTPNRLATIFRTNMQASYAVGAWEQIEAQAEDAPYLMYDAVDDFRTRPAHRAWDNKVLRWDDKWWRTHYPPNGFNSVVPNQRVSGFAYLGLKAWYSGPVVEVVGRSGGRFTVTAQHPVLTTRGWVDAKDLRKGDQLVAYSSDVGLSSQSADLHKDDLPPTIEQAFEALSAGACASLQRAALYLNGDVEFFDGDVDVVGLDRELVEHVQASASEFVAKLLLLKADHAVLPAEPGHCALAPINGGGSGDGAGLEGDFAQMAGSVLPFNAGLSVRFDPISAKVTCNILPAFPESLGKLPQSHAGLVQLNDSIRHGFSDFRPSPPAKFFANNPRGLGFGSLGNSSIAKRFIGGFEVNANAHGDIIDAHAGLVELDDVADLIFRDYNGHVYDLQTATGNIAAFGGVGKPHYVISNCRCSVIQLDDNDLDGMGLSVDKAPRNRFEDWRNPRTGQTERIPEGVDPGFDHNPGQRRMEELRKLQGEKIKALPKDMRDDAQEGVKKAQQEAEKPITIPPVAKAQEKPRKLTKKERFEQYVTELETHHAEKTGFSQSINLDGMREIIDAVAVVNARFGLEKLAYIGDPDKSEWRFRLPRRAMGGYSFARDAFIFRNKLADPEYTKEQQALDDKHKGRNPWAPVADRLRNRYRNEEAALIAEKITTGGRSWGMSNTTTGVAYHEMGHRLHALNKYQVDAIVVVAFNNGWAELISQYATTNPAEFMAEAFALYMAGDESQFFRIYPPLLAWFRRKEVIKR